jgi:hypothetical protein
VVEIGVKVGDPPVVLGEDEDDPGRNVFVLC